MRTTLKIENGAQNLEVELKIIDGKQIIEMPLEDLLALMKPSAAKKSPAAVKAANTAKGAKAAKTVKVAKAPKAAAAGAKRGRKPKASDDVTTVSDPTGM
jgi:hypothetical protein